MTRPEPEAAAGESSVNHEHAVSTWLETAHVSFAGPVGETADGFAGSDLPVLIRVPVLLAPRRGPRPARRPSERVSARFHANDFRQPRARAPRRRLRKGVRLTGYAVLATFSLAFASLMLRSGAGAATPVLRPGQDVPSIAAAIRSPAISLMIEGASWSEPAEADRPVVLPGYVLPDDGCEEQGHAGG